MNMTIKKAVFLKWLLMPVILCVKLIVVQTEAFILCLPLYNTFCICENTVESRIKRNTAVDDKVRMNN